MSTGRRQNRKALTGVIHSIYSRDTLNGFEPSETVWRSGTGFPSKNFRISKSRDRGCEKLKNTTFQFKEKAKIQTCSDSNHGRNFKINDSSKLLKNTPIRSIISANKKNTTFTNNIVLNELLNFSSTVDSKKLEPSVCERPSFFIKKTRKEFSSIKRNLIQTNDSTEPVITLEVQNSSKYFQFKHPDPEYGDVPLEFFRQASLALKELNMDKFATIPSQPSKSELLNSDKPILVLDLDETLVHCCNFDGSEANHEISVSYLATRLNTMVTAKLNLRPRVSWFLKKISQHYQVVVYTASEFDYAQAVCRVLDPENIYFTKIYARHNCIRTEKGYLVKDLRMLTGLNTTKIVLVDNSPHCFAPQIHNGIPILPYYQGRNDNELPKLYEFLMQLKEHPSLPVFSKKYFGLSKLVKCQTDEDLIKHFESIGMVRT